MNGFDPTKDDDTLQAALRNVEAFYARHSRVFQDSHGFAHSMAVYNHALEAVRCCQMPLSFDETRSILLAALLHDVDDHKYFSGQDDEHKNAIELLESLGISETMVDAIIEMISLVSCTKNGNNVPKHIQESNQYHLLIPRWCDRLEAVGITGVIRCFQYTKEHGGLLFSEQSPRPKTENEVWEFATPERFEAYRRQGGSSSDMISHYYDKLLHIARPPSNIVRNAYLEKKGQEGAKPLIDICLQFGLTGTVDEQRIVGLKKVNPS